MKSVSRRAAIIPLLVALIVFLTADIVVFGPTGPYWRWTKPRSYPGKTSLVRQTEGVRIADPRHDVLIVGDSRIAVGISPARAAARARGDSLAFYLAVAEGTQMRTWACLLERLDPRADRYAAILIPMLEFHDRDVRYTGGPNTLEPANARTDLQALLPLVQPWDAPSILGGIEDRTLLVPTLRVLAVKGLAYRKDIVDLASDPRTRRTLVEAAVSLRERNLRKYQGIRKSLRGLSYDPNARRVRWHDGLEPNPAMVARIERCVEAAIPDSTGHRARYYERWLGAIVRHYEGSDTKLLLLPLPRAPLLSPRDRVPPRGGLPLRLAREGRVVLMDDRPVRRLERPEMFADALHLNGTGRHDYSVYVGKEVDRILRGAPAGGGD